MLLVSHLVQSFSSNYDSERMCCVGSYLQGLGGGSLPTADVIDALFFCLRDHQNQPSPARQNFPVKDELLPKVQLYRSLERFGFREIVVSDDGHCLFRALAIAIFNNQHFFQVVRNLHAYYITLMGSILSSEDAAATLSEFNKYAEQNAASFEEYSLHVKNDQWGSMADLAFFVDVCHCNVRVYRTSGAASTGVEMYWDMKASAYRGQHDLPNIHLLHKGGTHWNLLVRIRH